MTVPSVGVSAPTHAPTHSFTSLCTVLTRGLYGPSIRCLFLKHMFAFIHSLTHFTRYTFPVADVTTTFFHRSISDSAGKHAEAVVAYGAAEEACLAASTPDIPNPARAEFAAKAKEYAQRAVTLQRFLASQAASSASAAAAPAPAPAAAAAGGGAMAAAAAAAPASGSTSAAGSVLDAGASALTSLGRATVQVNRKYDLTGKVAAAATATAHGAKRLNEECVLSPLHPLPPTCASPFLTTPARSPLTTRYDLTGKAAAAAVATRDTVVRLNERYGVTAAIGSALVSGLSAVTRAANNVATSAASQGAGSGAGGAAAPAPSS